MLDCSTRSLNWLLPKAESMWSSSCPSEQVCGKFSRELSLASPSILFFTCLPCFLSQFPSFSHICFLLFHACFVCPPIPLASLIFSFPLVPFNYILSPLSHSFLPCSLPPLHIILDFVAPHLLPSACSAAVVGSWSLSGSPGKLKLRWISLVAGFFSFFFFLLNQLD